MTEYSNCIILHVMFLLIGSDESWTSILYCKKVMKMVGEMKDKKSEPAQLVDVFYQLLEFHEYSIAGYKKRCGKIVYHAGQLPDGDGGHQQARVSVSCLLAHENQHIHEPNLSSIAEITR